IYFALQGGAVAAWWALLCWRPELRLRFLPPGNHPSALLGFALPDGLLLAAGSLLVSGLLVRSRGWATLLACFVAGAVGSAAALVTTSFALLLSSERLPLFRKARAGSARWNVAKTLLQIVLFWTFFLAVVPAFLIRIEATLGVPRFAFAGQRGLAAALFAALS